MADHGPGRTIVVFSEDELQAAIASALPVGGTPRHSPLIDDSWERHVEHWLQQRSAQPVQMHRMTLEQIEAHLVHRRTAFPGLRARLALLLTRSLRGLLARGDWQ